MTHAKPGQAEHRERSCYVLELSIAPTPSTTSSRRLRRGDVFVYNRLVYIRRCLEFVLSGASASVRADTLELTLAGQGFTLWIVEEGRLKRGIDLRPHIGARLGPSAIRLADVVARDRARATWTAREEVVFEIDWDAIAKSTPALEGEPLHPGESLELFTEDDVLAPFDSYLEITESLVYGYEDLECGRKAPAGFVDPDPARRP